MRRLLLASVVLLCLAAAIAVRLLIVSPAPAPQLSFTAIDTMKESMDTETRPLADAQIADDVRLAATLPVTHIAVDTRWDYAPYLARWVAAVRAAGKHVWFRLHPDQWEDSDGATGIMTPAAYEAAERAFILTNSGLFRPGDILDPCPEPENGLYWASTYGQRWSWGAPNAATREFNAFIRDTTAIADTALHQMGIYGVVTTVRSTNGWFATHPGDLEAATVAMLGRITVDSYPEGATIDPATAAAARAQELDNIHAIWHVPVVIGEMGYSNEVDVDDATQQRVLRAELDALSHVPYIAGVNYWVGAGTTISGGFTNLFSGSAGNWGLRPAARDLAAFYAKYGSTPTPAASGS